MNRHGAVLADVLLSLLLVLLLLPAVSAILWTAASAASFTETVQDEIAIAQLRRTMMLTYDVNVYDTSLTFRRKGKDETLRMVNGRLILQPGTLIYLSDIDSVSFYEEGGIVHLVYERDERETDRSIAFKEN